MLVHTEKGGRFVGQLIQENRIIAEERPVQEPILGDERLRHPMKKTSARERFERLIRAYDGDFEKTMRTLMPQAVREERLKAMLRLPQRVISKLLRIAGQ